MKKLISDSLGYIQNKIASGYRDAPFKGLRSDCWQGDLNWMEKAAVWRIPEDAFKRGYEWNAEADQITAIERLEKQLKIKQKKKQALGLSRLDGEAFIYFDLGQSPNTPLRIETVTAGRLRFVNVLRRDKVKPLEIVTDPMSEYYGMSEYYEINTNAANPVRIHASRLARFVHNPSPENGKGQSVLWQVHDVIRDAIKARCNAAGLTEQARAWVLSINGLAQLAQDEPDAVVQRLQLFQQGLTTNSLAAIDAEGESLGQQSTSFAGITDVIESLRREVAAAIEIPYSLLFGLQSGLGSNGTTDHKEYYDNVKVVQEEHIDTPCTLLDRCVVRSAIGDDKDGEIFHQWRSLFEMTDKEKAELAKSHADTAKIYVDTGIIPADVFTNAAINDMVEIGIFQGIEQDAADAQSRILAEEEQGGDESDVIGRDLPDEV